MANTPAPFGFMQATGLGSVPTYEQNVRKIAYNAAAIYRGDPTIPVAAGTIQIAPGGADTVQLAGIFDGCEYLSVAFQRIIWNAVWPGNDVANGQYATAYVIDDPNAVFIAQSGAVGLTLADVGANVNINIGTPNPWTKQSGAYVETPGATATQPFRVREIITTPVGPYDNPVEGPYAIALLAFNNVTTKTLTGIA